MMQRLSQLIEKFDRIELGRLPTPMTRLNHLSEKLGYNIFMKRDDLTDLALGGDKARKLSFEIAKAKRDEHDMILTCGSAQSNHARLTTAAAIRAGLKSSVVLSRDEHYIPLGNLLITEILGARIFFEDVDDHWDLDVAVDIVLKKLRKEGYNPYYIPVSGTTILSCLGYVHCAAEIEHQRLENRIDHFDYIVSAFGTGGIFTSLNFGFTYMQRSPFFLGISVNRECEGCADSMANLWSGLNEILGLELLMDLNNVDLFDNFIGKEYGDATLGCIKAIKLMAQTEGILLDPVYTGKMFHGFLELAKQGRFSRNDNILLIHSGGVPALFAYHEYFNFSKKIPLLC